MTVQTTDTAPIPATVQVAVRKLVFDTGLQCRTEVHEDVVREYAEAMAEGARFPPIEVVRADGELYVVDGWHRAHAAKAAKVKLIDAVVVDGTLRDATLRAVQANGNHGLRRSTDDKRRAVRTLLCDEEWSRLSNRELATLANVSHAFVGQTRRHYQVAKGEPLTAERIDDVDGEPSAEWVALADRVPPYYRSDVLSLRKQFTITELVNGYHIDKDDSVWPEAYTLQLSRIAARCGDPWPWSDDTTADSRATRLRILNDPLDFVAALTCPDCPEPLKALRALRLVQIIPKAAEYVIEQAKEREWLAGWTGIQTLLDERLVAMERDRMDQPPTKWELARALQDIDDPDDQANAVKTASSDVLDALAVRCLSAAARSEYRYMRGESAHDDCTDVACDGWLRPQQWGDPRCSVCGRSTFRVREEEVSHTRWLGEHLAAGGCVHVAGRVLTAETLSRLPALNPVGSEAA